MPVLHAQSMEWSIETSLILIDEYRQQPVLWDPTHGYYSSKARKAVAWETVAANLGIEVKEARQKMNSLLGSFRRERSKVRRSCNGSGTGPYYVSNWFAFKSMEFLMGHEYLRSSNLQTPMNGDTLEFKVEEDEFSPDLLEEDLSNMTPSESQPHPATQSHPQHRQMPEPTPPRLKRAKRNPKPLEPSLDTRLDDEFSFFPVQDEYSLFGQYIAQKLRKFDARTRAFVEHAINNILFEADMGKYDNAPSPFVTIIEQKPIIVENSTMTVPTHCVGGAPSTPTTSYQCSLNGSACPSPDITDSLKDVVD